MTHQVRGTFAEVALRPNVPVSFSQACPSGMRPLVSPLAGDFVVPTSAIASLGPQKRRHTGVMWQTEKEKNQEREMIILSDTILGGFTLKSYSNQKGNLSGGGSEE